MNAEVIPFKRNINSSRQNKISREQQHKMNHKTTPLIHYAIAGLNKSLIALGSKICLPADLECKMMDPDYSLTDERPAMKLLDEWEQAFLLYGMIEFVHNRWVRDHADEFFGDRYRGNEVLFLPLQLIGDAGFFQYMSESFLDFFERLGLDKGMKINSSGVRTYPYLEKMRIIRRNLYFKEKGIGSVKSLQNYLSGCEYESLSEEARKALKNDKMKVFAIAQDVVAYNPGKF